jgi:hypothetical protein
VTLIKRARCWSDSSLEIGEIAGRGFGRTDGGDAVGAVGAFVGIPVGATVGFLRVGSSVAVKDGIAYQ